MDKNEKYLKQKLGTKVPFTVPEGYFEGFTERMMQRLPEQKAQVVVMHPWWNRYRVAIAAAACFCAAIFGTGIYLKSSTSQQQSVATANNATTDNTFDQMADYVMMDNEAIYASLSDY